MPHNCALATLTPGAALWADAAAKERVAVFGARTTYKGAAEHAKTVGRIREILGLAESIVPKRGGMRPAYDGTFEELIASMRKGGAK